MKQENTIPYSPYIPFLKTLPITMWRLGIFIPINLWTGKQKSFHGKRAVTCTLG